MDKFLCSFEGCEKSFKRKDKLTVHLRTHTGERPFVCRFDGCTSSYARQQHLSRHISKSHTSGLKDKSKVRCPSCSLELADKTCLKKHILSFHDQQKSKNVYECTEKGCAESFLKKKQLVAHKLNHHSDQLVQARKCYSCPHEGCEKSFTFPNKLKHHMKIHQGYACDAEGCTQVLPNWSSLRKHKAVEHAPTHSCNVCGAVFKQKSNWSQHIKIHSVSQKPQKCSEENCNRLFLYKKNLVQHIREFHKGESIWKNRIKKKSHRSHKKKDSRKQKKDSKKKSLAARMCGIEKSPQKTADELGTDALLNDVSATSQCSVGKNYVGNFPGSDVLESQEERIETPNTFNQNKTNVLHYSDYSDISPIHPVTTLEYNRFEEWASAHDKVFTVL